MKSPINSVLKSQNGFTLIELSISIVISSIIALSAGSLVLISSNQLTLSTIDVQTVRDHAIITQFLSENIKEGLGYYSCIYSDSSKSTPGNSGTCLSIMALDSSTINIYKGGNDCVVVSDQGYEKRLVRHILTNLTFTNSYAPDSSKIIQVALTINRNGSPITTNHNYSFRN